MRWRTERVLASWLLGAACGVACMTAAADEIDDILAAERMAYAEHLESEAAAAVEEPAEDARAEASRMPTDVRRLQEELAQARAQIALLKEEVKTQRERHMLELQSSYYNMGCVYRAAGQYERAEAEFLKALEVNPEDAAVHYNLAILYDDDLDRKQDARRHYESFLELAPNDPDAARVLEWLTTMD